MMTQPVARLLRAALLPLMLVPAMASAQSSGLQALDTDHEAKGWEAVGRVDTGIGYCTGTLIAPDLVLTAAHCVYNMRTGAPIDKDRFQFRAGYRQGKAVATRKVSQIAAHPDFDAKGRFNGKNVSHDLALLRLAEPIPTSQIDPFILHDERVAPGEVSIVSYGRGRSEVQSRQRNCSMTDRQGDLLAFNCDVTNGSSGSPVFSHLNGRGRILSVISGETTYRGREIALGMHLPPLIDDLKADLRATSAAPTAAAKRIRLDQKRPGLVSIGSDASAGTTQGGAKFVRAPGS